MDIQNIFELLNFNISSVVWWIILSIIVGIWMVLSWVLLYHWQSYGMKDKNIRRMKIFYFGSSLALVITAGILIVLL